jgi:ATP-dependent helicase/nuclease subunit B
MTEVQKHFLGWDTPFLPTAAKWLQEHCLYDELGAAKDLVIVVSGNAVARRLQTYFVNEANKVGRAVELPSIVTTSQLFKKFMPFDAQIADRRFVLLAIVACLKSKSSNELRTLIGERPINSDDFFVLLQVATKVLETIKIATGGGYSVDCTSWPKDARDKLTPDAFERFSLLREIELYVQKELDGDSFESLQHQLVQHDYCLNIASIKKVIVVGCSDLSRGATMLLQRVAAEGIEIDALLRAPETEEEGFDSYGRLVTQYWMDKRIAVDDANIVVAGSPSSQSAEVVRALAALDGKAGADEITVAATDEKMIPSLQRHIRGHNVKSRFAGGSPTLQTPEALFVSGIAEFISSQSYASYASLVRHPDIKKIASVTEETLKQLSDYSANVVPSRITSGNWFFPKKSRCCFDQLEELHTETFDFLKEYIAIDGKPASFTSCSTAIRGLLLKLYGDEELDRTSMRLKALQKMFGVLDSFDATHEKLNSTLGDVRLTEAIRFMLKELEQDTIAELPDPLAIETVGWLEAMVVDTPNLIVVGMGADLGGSNNPSDAYFPDHLCEVLGIETIERRMARDAHALIAMQQSRKQLGNVKWIVGRTNTDGDPLSPSPLLMRCENSKELAARAGRLVVCFDNEEPEVPPQYAPKKLGLGIQLPKPSDFTFDPLKKLRVTGFKDYLACPYRFWLKHVMKLKVAEDGHTELDAKLFGSFVHSVLERFGNDTAMRKISDVKKIEQTIFSALEDVAKEQLGSKISSKIKIQLELAKHRLKEFAKHQARSVEEGWEIVCTECFKEKEIDVQGRKFSIRGTIDRVEVNRNGQVRVLDYKTGSTTANEAHCKKDSWIDLQLPLYRELLTEIPELHDYCLEGENVLLGYFIIGDQEATSGIDLLTPKKGLQDILQDTIEGTINSILDNEYSDIPADPAPKFSDDFSWICQDSNVIEESSNNYDD